PLAAAAQSDSEQFRSSPRTSRLLWGILFTSPDRSRQQSAEAVADMEGQNKRLTPRSTLGSGKLEDRTCQPATKYKNEMPLPLVLHFASRALKPLWIVLARLHSRESWRPYGTTLKKHEDTWLKFGSCIRQP